nr:hypothetical protein [Enterococcus gallinarum]
MTKSGSDAMGQVSVRSFRNENDLLVIPDEANDRQRPSKKN